MYYKLVGDSWMRDQLAKPQEIAQALSRKMLVAQIHVLRLQRKNQAIHDISAQNQGNNQYARNRINT
jgi:hypothetical protein